MQPSEVGKMDRAKPKSVRRIVTYVILLAVVVAGGIYAYNLYTFGLTHVGTDDAQIDGHIDPVIPRIGGYVTSVLVNDNQLVKKGDVLVRIDPRELQLKLTGAEEALKEAQVALSTAEAGEHNAEAGLAVAQANVQAAKVAYDKADADMERDRNLLASALS